MSENTIRASLERDDQGRAVVRTSDRRRDRPRTDWARLEAMTPEENRTNAESDPDAVILTDDQRRRLQPVPDPRAIRQGLGLTQQEFAHRFEIPLGTLSDWEQGRRFIDATARVLLRTIALAPEVVEYANAPSGRSVDAQTEATHDPSMAIVSTSSEAPAVTLVASAMNAQAMTIGTLTHALGYRYDAESEEWVETELTERMGKISAVLIRDRDETAVSQGFDIETKQAALLRAADAFASINLDSEALGIPQLHLPSVIRAVTFPDSEMSFRSPLYTIRTVLEDDDSVQPAPSEEVPGVERLGVRS